MLPAPTLDSYLVVAAALFTISIIGIFLNRRNEAGLDGLLGGG